VGRKSGVGRKRMRRTEGRDWNGRNGSGNGESEKEEWEELEWEGRAGAAPYQADRKTDD
jgi:hypothetical protein